LPYDIVTRQFRALGNHRRRMVLEIIWEHSLQKPGKAARPYATVTEIARRLRLSQPATSQYVERLAAVKLVDVRRVGPAHLLIPNADTVSRLRGWLDGLSAGP
jgi:DNA-binding transcriptional ArsR family regulator